MQAADDGLGAALQKLAQVVDHLAITGLIHRADARRRAQFDVVVQASPLILAGDLTVAGQVGENPAQHVQGLVHRPDAGVRAEVTRAILDHLAGDGNLREGIRPVHLDVWIALIVLQAHIEMRSMLLDQVHLQDQGFELRANHDPFDVDDIVHQLERARVGLRAVKVGTHPVAQVNRLADINHPPGSILH